MSKSKPSAPDTTASNELQNAQRPPYSLPLEQAVLAALMSINESWEKISELLKEHDFYAPRHQLIFKGIHQLATTNQPYDVVMVNNWLNGQQLLEEAGGEPYLIEILTESPASLYNLEAYAKRIHEMAVLREVIQVSQTMLQTAYNAKNRSASEVLNELEASIFAIKDKFSNHTENNAPQPLVSILRNVLIKVDHLQKSGDSITGIPTGFSQLDERTSGLQPSDLIIVAARPSMGKTTFAMNLIESALFKTDLPAVVFSMEMPADSLVIRLLSSMGTIDQGRLRSGRMDEGDWVRMMSTITQLEGQQLYIDDSPALSPNELRARCRRIAKQHNNKLGIIMIDYLQLMRVPGISENRTGEISEISRSLKALAKEMNCPVVALSQLNRGLESRPNKRPLMSDLRESGAIEQDADLIMFIYRDEVYNKESAEQGIAEIIIGKQRNGPIGTVRLQFEGVFTRFRDLQMGQYDYDDE